MIKDKWVDRHFGIKHSKHLYLLNLVFQNSLRTVKHLKDIKSCLRSTELEIIQLTIKRQMLKPAVAHSYGRHTTSQGRVCK